MKNVEDAYHLTPVQREILSETQSVHTARVVQYRWNFYGKLDSGAFERAWERLLTRHTILRTCFLSEQLEEPVQVVRQQVKLQFERLDWTEDPPEQQQAKLQDLLLADRQRDFDPARAPLFRLMQIRLGVSSFQVILSHHPVLLDERSVSSMLNEVLACYRAGLQNSECLLASAPPYRAYVGWVGRQDLAGAELYWRTSLNSSSLRSSLARRTNEDGECAATFPPASRRVNFPAAATEALKAFARREHLSFETLVAGAWSLALMRERKCREVSIGVAARERPRGLPESEQMVGLLKNVLPLHLSFAREEPISPWLHEVERRIAHLQRYAHISRAQIKHWIGLENEVPLVDSVAIFHETATAFGEAELGTGLTINSAVDFSGVVNSPLWLEAVLGDALSLRLHAEGRDGDSTVTRLMESLQNIWGPLTFPTLYLSQSSLPTHAEPDSESAIGSNGREKGVRLTASRIAEVRQYEKPLDFSLFYFADDNAVCGVDKYRLYREGAIFADRHRLTAVWTPERHFHEKAGLYPNPAVLSAALATITEHIQLRAGSVVLPLHNSLRVAEEWSVVDNLSNGRVGVSFTSGWMPNDFAFFPERYAVKREEMFRGIQEVQDLWRGKSIAGRDGLGKEIELRIFPKPISAELPMWLTCSGGPEMFEKAGELGCHVLTALLTQSIEEVTPKIKLYRDSLVRHGHHADDGKVTMMMHTFIGEDAQAVLQKVRIPLTNYLRSHLNLIETGAQSLNLQVDIGEQEDAKKYKDQLAAFAFERYYRTSSLIGTPGSCMKMVERLKAIGVDEVACLIDFGIDVDSVIESLAHLVVLRELSDCRQPVTSRGASTLAHV
jgi:natural product biosynthesis luciferase-like monooxygenase protein